VSDPLTVELTAHGETIALYLPDPSDPIQKRILDRAGFDQPTLLEDARARVRRGDLCIDVGAHLGNHTVFFARVCGMRVIAFESRPDLYQALRRNVELNHLEDAVQTFQVALGGSGPVAISTLDEQVGDQQVALIRIDVEGAELEVLKGAERTIARDRPIIYAGAADARSRESLAAFLSARGYVAIDEVAGTSVVVFVPRRSEEQRRAALAYRDPRRPIGALSDDVGSGPGERPGPLEQRLARLEAAVAGLAPALERLARTDREHSALLYELWNLGAQNHELPASGAGVLEGRAAPYRPLNVRASELAAWVPRRRSWTVPKGTNADGFLQGFSSQLSVHPGDEVDLRLSTDQVGLFARARVFGPGPLASSRREELHSSPPLYVPSTGVWEPGGREVDEQGWQVVHRFRVEHHWKPGCYIVRFETVDGKATLHHFWVTSAAPASRAVQLSALFTHAARNRWGGADLHGHAGRFRFGRSGRPHPVRLSRPYRGARGSSLLRHELSVQRWASASGLHLDALTDVEVHARPELLAGYEQVVIAGDASYLTGPVLAALRSFRDGGGRIAVFGAAPGQVEVDVDLAGGTVALRPQGPAERADWSRASADLWLTGDRWTHEGSPLDLAFLAPVEEGVAPLARLPRASRVHGLCSGRLSGSTLASDDPRLLARTVGDGQKRCDTFLVATGAGSVFVAGTDRWFAALDDSEQELSLPPEIASVTAGVLEVSAEAPGRGPARPRRGAGGRFDVILMSDFRFPGGTTHSNAEEIHAQARLGLSTGLVQVNSPVLKRERPINPIIQRCLDAGEAELIPAGPVVPRARLLVVRHPTVLMREAAEIPRVEAENLAVIINQPPLDAQTGRRLYSLAACQERARERFGLAGQWFPIGPLVRKAIQDEAVSTAIAPVDWTNIIDIEQWRAPRAAYVGDRPVIGRHSRDSADKWPADPGDILAAYPADDRVRVRILGGAETARAILGQLPARWEVLPFGAMTAREFLAGIDFFVYFHHPRWIEAFGRTILEAMAAGAPTILPPHFAELFGDAAIYCEPAGVRAAVDDLHRDRARYEERSRRGLALVESRFSHAAHARRLADMGCAPDSQPADDLLDSADLEADSVYKVDVDLGGLGPDARGQVRGVSRTTGQSLFEAPVDGEAKVSAFVVTRERPDHMDVLLSVEGGGAAPASAARVRVRRRADRPRPTELRLTDDSVTAAMATYPARRGIVPAVLDTLLPQVDRLFLYLNNYDEVPDFIRQHPLRERIVFILDPASQKRAAAKFSWLDTVRGFHLICDDDILYPPDYVARMRAAIDRRQRQAIVGVHGILFARNISDARSSRRAVFKFRDPLAADTPVHFLGTGTVALHTSTLARLDLSRFMAYPIANDEVLAVSARGAGVPMICIAREADWLTPHPDVRFGIFEERSIDSEEHDRATELLVSGNPWPDLGAEPG